MDTLRVKGLSTINSRCVALGRAKSSEGGGDQKEGRGVGGKELVFYLAALPLRTFGPCPAPERILAEHDQERL